MKKEKIDAKENKKLPGGLKTVDTLPPVIINLTLVYACNKKEAIVKGKPILAKREEELKKFT